MIKVNDVLSPFVLFSNGVSLRDMRPFAFASFFVSDAHTLCSVESPFLKYVDSPHR